MANWIWRQIEPQHDVKTISQILDIALSARAYPLANKHYQNNDSFFCICSQLKAKM